MPNIIDANGLTLATQAELVAYYTAKFQAIYGADINLDSSSPDGQLMNIVIQSVLDVQDLLMQINNMFDPDNAIGVILDQRVSINGIQRQAGTFSVTNITVTVNQALTLYGLDQSVQPVYTIQDNAGTKWELQTTQVISVAGSYVYPFQAANAGAVLTSPNTITIPVTIVLGVLTVNNPTAQSVIGLNEETDAVLKVRRQKSVSLASQGYYAGLLAALENINGVSSAFIYENTGDTINVDGVPGHSIWVIVAGAPASADVANAIYTKRNAGCGMFGSTSYIITQIDDSPFIIYWDFVSAQNLFIVFTASSVDGVNDPHVSLIQTNLPTIFTPGVYAEVNINQLATLVQQIDSNCLVTNAGFSTGQTQIMSLSGVAASGTFKINYNGNLSAVINWNDSTPTIQSKIQAVTGLSAALVTGSIASQTLNFDLTAITSVQAILYVVNNSLATSAPVDIDFAYDWGTTNNTLFPTSKKYQFAVTSPLVVMTPMLLLPATSSVVPAATVQFSAQGGYGAYTYSISINTSGATISPTGLYTAGVVSGTDTIKVTDVLGNFKTALVAVA